MITALATNSDTQRRLLALVAPRTGQLMELGHRRGWNFEVLGQAPCPTQPVRAGDWLIVPIEQDTGNIPARALARVQAIYAAGLDPKRFAIVHELPSTAINRPRVRPTRQIPRLSTETKAQLMTGAVTAIKLSLAATVAVARVVLPIMAAVASAAAVDPILIAITDDDYWIEIDRWYTEA